jgi:rRNA maturation endonuclease Nob1
VRQVKCDNCGEEADVTAAATPAVRFCPFCGSESVTERKPESAADAARRGVNALYTDTGRTPPGTSDK